MAETDLPPVPDPAPAAGPGPAHYMNVNTGGGAFAPGGKIVEGDEFTGDKIMGDKILGDKVVQVFVSRGTVQDIETLEPEPGNPPYKGLLPFDLADADLFFGRDRLIGQVVSRLATAPFLAVVGASGSGKSSLVRAGVLPALLGRRTLPEGSLLPAGSAGWAMHVFKPTSAPLQALADSLTRDEPDLLAGSLLSGQMAADPRILALAARKVLSRQGRDHLLLVVDQFEELFTLCANPAERQAFLNNLVWAVSPQAQAPLTVILTLRADFYAQCGVHDGLRSLLSQKQEYIGAMTPEELFEAIVRPIAASGQWQLQNGLAGKMLEDIGAEPGALALLSHTLLETWKRRRGHVLTLSGYQEAGGIRGAIAQTAETAYTRLLAGGQQTVARSIFLRLTELGDGTPDTRRRATVEELASSLPDQDIHAVLKVLAQARLVVTDRDAASGVEVVEVAHEALIRHWRRLRLWLEEDQQLLRMRQEVRQAAANWLANAKAASYLDHRAERFKQVAVLLSTTQVTLDQTERQYLEACQHLAYLEKASIAKSGWGVIFHAQADPAVRYALRELLALRQAQASEIDPRYYHEFSGPDGYQPGESVRQFLARHEVGSSRATPDRMPYYLLIVGDPEAIPFSFQYQLDMRYAVGRIYFDTLEEYAQYAASVVAAESQRMNLAQRAVIFAALNKGDRATPLAIQHLATPLAEQLEKSAPGWQVERVFAEAATRERLAALLGGADTPAVLFSCGHGIGYPLNHALQLEDQGALLCSDWAGGPVKTSQYFAARDVDPQAGLTGSIFYFWSCYGAGTPKLDNYAEIAFKETAQQIAPHSFIAQLPRKLLGHPKGGALAVIGSVERKWAYSFTGELGAKDLDIFLTTLRQIMEGYPVGAAMEYFNQRYAALMSDLVMLLERSREGQSDPRELAQMWTATTDARNYIIIGDPAVRVPCTDAPVTGRATIQAGLRLDPEDAARMAEMRPAAQAWESGGRSPAGLQPAGDRLDKINSLGSLVNRDEPLRSYLRASNLYPEVLTAAYRWEVKGRPPAGLAHTANGLAEIDALGLSFTDDPAAAYLAACRQAAALAAVPAAAPETAQPPKRKKKAAAEAAKGPEF